MKGTRKVQQMCSANVSHRNPARLNTIFLATALLVATGTAVAQDQDNIPYLPAPVRSVSTIPSNGDVNPYGVAFVPNGFATGGVLNPGDVLVSNFNNAMNLQGTGTTITRVPVSGTPSTFFQASQPNFGLTGALVLLRAGYVIVGNLPTIDGTAATVQAGSMLLIDKNGKLVINFADANHINGPWGAAVIDEGSKARVFVSNVLSGTIERFNLTIGAGGVTIDSVTEIGSGFNHRTDPAALVLGPSGLLYDARKDELFVASSADNAVYGLRGAAGTTKNLGTGRLVYQDLVHLHGPLDLAMTPNGHLLVANSDGSNVDPNQPSEVVEFTTGGTFVRQISVDPNNGGAFGLAIGAAGDDLTHLAAVDDNASTLTIWTIFTPE